MDCSLTAGDLTEYEILAVATSVCRHYSCLHDRPPRVLSWSFHDQFLDVLDQLVLCMYRLSGVVSQSFYDQFPDVLDRLVLAYQVDDHADNSNVDGCRDLPVFQIQSGQPP